jgi:ankyrin repeat protein
MRKELFLSVLIFSTLCAGQVPQGATAHWEIGDPNAKQQGRVCGQDFYKSLESELLDLKAPLTLVHNESEAGYAIRCVAPDDMSEIMRAVLANQRPEFTKALSVRDNQTRKVVWTATCVSGSDQELAKCLANHLKEASKTGGEDVNAQYGSQGTPLHIAALCGELDVAEYLVNRGAKVNAETSAGVTPLHRAAEGGSAEIARFLVAHGANVNATDRGGVTPLHISSSEDHLAVAEFLVASGADVNARVKDGSTPLHIAAHAGNLDVVEFLVTHGAEMNARGEGGLTPLHVAVYGGQTAVVKFLAEHGADLNARNKQGLTPLKIALLNKQADMAEYLRQQGAHQ